MIVREIYETVLEVVESEIALPDGWLHGSKTEDATDARSILCNYLRIYGLSSAQIQLMTGLKKSSVNLILSGLDDRKKRRDITMKWWLQIGRRLDSMLER